MTDALSLWGMVAQRYAAPRDLVASGLTGRFAVRFESATLIIRKSNGVERVVDFDEFRAAWRIMAAGGEDVTLRLVTASGSYLRAVRDDLIALGVPPDTEAELTDASDLGTAERHLVDDAARWSRPVSSVASGVAKGLSNNAPAQTDHGGEAAELIAELSAERHDREELVRENARLIASIETLEDRLRLETDRADKLEAAVERFKSNHTQVGIGSGTEIAGALTRVSLAMLKESVAPEHLRRAAETAVRLVHQDPPSAITKARVVTELLVKQQWEEVFGADAKETRKLFGDYARELDGQPSVDSRLLGVERTLYRFASPGAHELELSSRRAAMVVLVLCAVLLAQDRRH